jgi:hypothetical protein
MRHEGVLAKRRHKPVYVLRRSPGDLPRYLGEATVIDFADDNYEVAFAMLSGVLPSPVDFLKTTEPPPPRRPRRPPRLPALARRRRRVVMVVMLIAALLLCLAASFALGLIG